MSDFLHVSAVRKEFRKGPATIEVLKDLDLDVMAGECVAIVGASGVGKSTLLNVVGALDRPSAGDVSFKGKTLKKRSSRELALFRNQTIGFVFQFHYLLPEFTALENVVMPLLVRRIPYAEAAKKAKDLLSTVGLEARIMHRPSELSGGEQQRVAIARALIGEPDLVLADEPTGNLDVETARSVMELLFSVARKKQRSLIIATHNPEIAAQADRILRLKDGKLLADAAS